MPDHAESIVHGSSVTRQGLLVASYRFRRTFAREWGGYLATVLLIGLLGGLAMGAVVGARRTQSSFPTLLERSHSSNLFALTGVYNPGIGLDNGYSPATIRAISHLRYVKDVASLVELNLLPLQSDGTPIAAAAGTSMNGSVDGEQFSQDRVIVTEGRLPDPRLSGEFAIDSATARVFGLHLGELVTFEAFTNEQAANFSSLAAVEKVHPVLRIRMRLVGLGLVEPTNLMQDDIDAGGSDVLFTPALTKRLLTDCVNTTVSALQLEGGSRHEAAVEAELRRVLPRGLPTAYVQLSDAETKAERTLLPESIALGVFGAIAGLALLVIASQAVARRLRSEADALGVLRALGADPATTIADGLIGVLGAVVAGSLLAVLVAVGLSPLAPLGPVRPYVPNGLDLDWTVLACGFAILVVVLGGFAVSMAVHAAPHNQAARTTRRNDRESLAAGAAVSAGLPVPVVTGIRFALEPGRGANRVPVRSAIVGAVLAVVVVVSTVTFGASLRTLVTHPGLYGWNWTFEVNGGGGLGDIAAGPAARLLDSNPYVAAWTGVYFATLSIDGQDVPVMGTSPNASVSPPILTGHELAGPGQVVLGPATLAELHKQVGDTVEVGAGAGPAAKLKIVGTATLPAIGIEGDTHLEMGDGALLDYELIPAATRDLYRVPPGPNAILVRDKPGANPRAALASLDSLVTRLDLDSNGAAVLGVQRPAEIKNYRTLGTTPTLLGVGLAAGAVTALLLTLVASVRRRRRDLALLKTLGFTRSQLAAAVAWQSTVAVAIGTVLGIPLGILLGRFLWDLFAKAINAVPAPTVPVTSVVVIALSALVLANLVAAVPGRVAARIPTALLLRAE